MNLLRAIRERPLLSVLLGLSALSLCGLGSFPLHEPDEGRYASIAAAMVRSGDWLTPRLSGIVYYEKPPLHFWAVATSLATFGRSAGAARLPAVLAFLMSALVVGLWARRVLGARAAWVAPLVFATLPLAAFLSRIVLVDTTLALLTTCCLFAAFRALVEPEEGEPAARRWVLLAWLAAGLAFLTKGPIGVVLPFSGLGVYLLLTRGWGRIRALLSPLGILLCAGIALPWFLWMAQEHGGYARAFFLEQNLARATTGGRFDRDAPLWFYLPVLLGGFAPWVLLLPASLRRVAGATLRPQTLLDRARLFWACALLVPLALLSCVGSKLAYYLLPLAPAVALLATEVLLKGTGAEVARPRLRRGSAGLLIGLGALLALGGLVGLCALAAGVELPVDLGSASTPARERARLLRWGAVWSALPIALPVAIVLGSLFVASGVRLWRGAWRASLALLAACVLAGSFAAPWAQALAEDAYSAESLLRALRPHVGSSGPVVCYRTFVRSLAFSLDRPSYLWVATYSEFGYDIEPGEQEYALQAREEDLQRLIREHPKVAIVARGDTAAQYLLDTNPGRLEVVGTCGERVILVRVEPKGP